MVPSHRPVASRRGCSPSGISIGLIESLKPIYAGRLRDKVAAGGPRPPLRREMRLAAGVELCRLFHVDRDRWPLRRREEEGAQVLTLGGRRLVADQSVDQRGQVLVQLVGIERNLADRGVNDPELV